MNEDINIKMLDFSTLQVGEKFFSFRDAANLGRESYKKTLSVKNETGAWTNAMNSSGYRVFIQYDQRVWVRK